MWSQVLYGVENKYTYRLVIAYTIQTEGTLKHHDHSKEKKIK